VIVPDWLDRAAGVRPEHPALVTPEETLSFAALAARVASRTRGLRAAGVTAGTHVGALLPNGAALVELVHAVPRLGATLVLLDPRGTPAEIARQVRRAGVRLVVADETTRAAAAGVDVDVVVGPLADPGVRVDDPPPLLDLAAPHTVVFTSGTAGDAKPVVLTAGNHWWSAAGSAARLGAHADDRWLACLPCWHVGGLAILLRSAMYATTVVLHAGFRVEAVERALHEDGITMVSLVPTALGRLRATRAPARLRCALVGGAAASIDLLSEAHAHGWPVAPTYGCTEAASQIATAAPGDPRGLAGTVGLPLLPTRVRIVRADDTVAGPGETGGIDVSGPTVTPGTLDERGTLVPPALDGWLRTGDLGSLDPDGALRVLGRRDDVIVTGGENVVPQEVEGVLASLPGVAEIAVAAVADPEWGHVVAAWVVPQPGAVPTLDALRAAARARLAPHKLPRRLYLVAALPRTAAGKVRRAALRAAG